MQLCGALQKIPWCERSPRRILPRRVDWSHPEDPPLNLETDGFSKDVQSSADILRLDSIMGCVIRVLYQHP